jgi:hypothetical protein
MPNRTLRSRVVEFEKDIGMLEVQEENLVSGQSVGETSVIMNVSQNQLLIGHNEEKSVSTELEKNTTEISPQM